MDQEVAKPEFCEKEYLVYLEKLNDQGTNMFNAAPYLQKEFGLSGYQSTAILRYWIFSKRR
ncbi:MAG TPA: hypothetical protein DDW50_18775 [Firmicutes bacterium]|jgi:hypothetical protein|nr:hypothetical protein [Bacillota bacterium]